jgi:hypothetical protein
LLDALTTKEGSEQIAEAFDNSPVQMLKFRCNIFLSSDPIKSPKLGRYLTIEEELRIKAFCEYIFGEFPNPRYNLSRDQRAKLKAMGIIKE